MSLDPDVLEDGDLLQARDPSAVLRALAGAGAQIRHGLESTTESLPARWSVDDRPRAVLVAARGGAAVVGDALAAIVGNEGPVPVVALTGSRLPAWVGALDLVICLSLSGQAEGAVAIAAEAGRRGAALVTIGADDSPLSQVAARFRGAHVPLPRSAAWRTTSAPTSRTAMWAMLTPALLVCDRLGLLPDGGLGSPADLAATAEALDAEAEVCRHGLESFVNPAKSLALDLDRSVPVLLGDSPLGAVAARRGASVLARTARVPALHGALPDDAGDIVATFDGPFTPIPDDVFADPELDGPAGVTLRLLLLDLADGVGFDVVQRLAEDSSTRTTLVQADLTGAQGTAQGSALSRYARLVARVDFTATYLALACGYNPAVTPHVADLRGALRR